MVPKTPSAQVKRLANFPELLHVPVDGQGRSRLEALTLARLMFVRHGCVPDGGREELSWPITDADAAAEWDEPNTGIFASIQKQVSIHSRAYQKFND